MWPVPCHLPFIQIIPSSALSLIFSLPALDLLLSTSYGTPTPQAISWHHSFASCGYNPWKGTYGLWMGYTAGGLRNRTFTTKTGKHEAFWDFPLTWRGTAQPSLYHQNKKLLKLTPFPYPPTPPFPNYGPTPNGPKSQSMAYPLVCQQLGSPSPPMSAIQH